MTCKMNTLRLCVILYFSLSFCFYKFNYRVTCTISQKVRDDFYITRVIWQFNALGLRPRRDDISTYLLVTKSPDKQIKTSKHIKLYIITDSQFLSQYMRADMVSTMKCWNLKRLIYYIKAACKLDFNKNLLPCLVYDYIQEFLLNLAHLHAATKISKKIEK